MIDDVSNKLMAKHHSMIADLLPVTSFVSRPLFELKRGLDWQAVHYVKQHLKHFGQTNTYST